MDPDQRPQVRDSELLSRSSAQRVDLESKPIVAMAPADSEQLDQYVGSKLEPVSLEANAQPAFANDRTPGNNISLLRYNKVALVTTLTTVVLFALIGVAGITVTHKRNNNAGNRADASNYAVGNLELKDVQGTEHLQVKSADYLTVNGQLRVANTLILSPMSAPSAAMIGQIYYDKVTNQPYFYNGSAFISLAQPALPQVVSSIGGTSGQISVGNGLQVTAGQLALSADTSRALNNRVATLVSGSASLTVSQDGNGNYRLTDSALVGKGTLGKIALYTDSGTLGASVLSQSGTSLITGGNLSVSGLLAASSIQQAQAGTSITVNAGADNIVFTAGGRTFTFPTVGTGAQTICTSGSACSSSGGSYVVLQPGTAQLDPDSGSSIFINNTGGGNLLQLQGAGSDRFVVTNGGTATLTGAFIANGASQFNGNINQSGVTSFTTGSGAVNLNGTTTVASTLNVQGATISIGAPAVQGALILNAGNSNTAKLRTVSTLGQNTTFILPDPLTTTATICLDTGNCAGAGGGIVGLGTAGRLAKFASGGTVGNSNLSEAGTTLNYDGNLVANAAAGFTGNLVNLEVNGSSKLSVDQAGNNTQAGTLTVNGTGLSTVAGSLTVGTGLGVTAGGLSVSGNSTIGGTLSGLTGLSSSGAITFSGLTSTGVVHNSAAGLLSTSLIVNADLSSGNFSNITGVGTLTSGLNIAAGQTYKIGGLDINAAGTLTNVAYLNQGNTFTGNNTYTGTLAVQNAGGLTLGIAGSVAGSINLANSSSSRLVALQGLTPTGSGNATITLPSIAGGTSDTVCLLSLGNCVGTGGGITGSGTAGQLAKFSGSGTIASSNLSESSSTLTYGGNLVVDAASGFSGNILDLRLNGVSRFGVNQSGGVTITGGLTLAGTTTLSSLNSVGIVHTNASGVLSTGPVVLGSETSGNFIANLSTLTGLSAVGNSGAGSTPALSVVYGTTANTAVQGNIQLTCAGGTGNLTGGGNTVTLGSNSSCNNISIVSSPTFNGTVSVTGAGGINIGVASATEGVLNLATAANNNIGSLKIATLGQGTTYTLPDPGAGTATICLNTGNCAGAGGGITGSGTSGKLAKFNGSGSLADSTLSESGTTLTTSGNVVIQGANSLALGLGSSVDGSIAFHNAVGTHTVTLQAPSTDPASDLVFHLPNAYGSNGSCLVSDGAGGLSFTACTGGAGGGVTSLAGQTGVLSLANSTASAGVITIDNASTIQKGIAQFNSTNFTASSGTINTIQDIAATASPTFASETLSGTLTVNGAGTSNFTGNITSSGTVQGTTVNATSVIQLNGTNINTAGTLTNVAYLNQANTFTGGLNTFSGDVAIQGASGLTIGNPGSVTGNLSLANNSNSRLVTLQGLSPTGTGNATIQFPSIAGGTTDTVCLLTLANCSGGGGGITGTGTAGKLAVFTGSNTVGNSNLSEAGSTLTYAGNLVANAANGFTGNILDLQVNSVSKFSVDQNGNMVAGTFNGATISGGTLNSATITGGSLTGGSISGGTLTAGDVNGLSVSGGVITNPTIAGTVTGSGSPTLSGFGTINGQMISSSANFTGTLQVQGSGGLTLGVAGSIAGNLNLANANSTRMVILQGLDPTGTGNATIQVPSIAGGTTDTVCLLTLANCAGAGGGVTTTGGTTGALPKFTSSTTLGDSLLSEAGSTLTYAGNMVINTANGFTGNLVNLEVNGSSKQSVDQAGNSVQAGTLTVNGTGSSTIAGSLTVGTGLGVTTGGISVTGNSTISGTLTALTGLTSAGSITFSGLNTAGVVHNSSAGLLSTGLITNADLQSGSFGNITDVGTLASGLNIASGQSYRINGVDINTGGALSNVAYLNQSNIFTSSNRFTSSLSVEGAAGLTLGVAGSVAGSLNLANASSSRMVVLQGINPTGTGNVTIQFPSLAGGSNDTVCLLSLANCAGAGGGVTATGGAANYVARFTGATTVSTGLLYDTGSAVSVGSTSSVGLFNVGATNQFQVSSAGAVTAVGVNSGAGLLQGTGGLTLTGTVALNTSGSNATNIGTGTNTGAITIGNTSNTSLFSLVAGSGNFSLDGAGGSTYNIGASTTTGAINIGGAAQTGNITVGQSTASNTINLGNATIAIGNTGTINIGTSATGTGKTVTTIGSLNGASSLTLQGGTGGVSLGAGGIANTVQIGNTTGAVAQTVNIGNNATASSSTSVNIGSAVGASPISIQSGTGGITATSTAIAGTGFSLQANNVTTGTGLLLAANALTMGSALSVSTTSGNLTSGSLASFSQSSTYTSISGTTLTNNLLNVSRNNITNVSAAGAISYDSSAGGTLGSVLAGVAMTWNHTINGANGNRLLLVSFYTNSTSCINTVTYGGIAMTQVPGASVVSAFRTAYVYYLKNPTGGTATVSVNSTCGTVTGFSSSYYNVDQTTAFGTVVTGSNNSYPFTTTVTSSVGDLVVDANGSFNTTAPTAGGSQTSYMNQSNGAFRVFGSYTVANSSSTSMAWSGPGSGSSGFQIAVPLKPASAPAALNVTGAVASFSSNCTVTSGPCNDTASVVSLNQQFASASGAVVSIQNAGSGADLQLGSGSIRPGSDSTAAIRIQNATGTGNNVLTADTTNRRIGINLASAPTQALDVGGNINASTGYLLNGVNINTAGTLSNVAYLNQNNSFSYSGTNTFTSSSTTGAALAVVTSATTGAGLTVTANALTTGMGLSVSTTSSSLSGGSLVSINHTATYGSTTANVSNLLNVSRNITTSAVTGGLTLDVSASLSYSSATTLTLPNVTPNSSRELIVGFAQCDANAPATLTYDGTQTLTQVTTVIRGVFDADCGSNVRVTLYALYMPNAGSNKVISGIPGFSAVIAEVWDNVDSTTPLGTAVTANGTGSTSAVVTSAVNEKVVDFVVGDSNTGTMNPGGSQTLVTRTTTNRATAAASYALGAASVTMSWTGSSGPMAAIAVPIRPASNASYATQGSVANFSSQCTQSGGVCVDSSNILTLSQQYGNATGAVLNIQNAGAGADILLGSSQTGKIQTASGSTSNGISLQSGAATGGASGAISILSGNASSGASGNVTIDTGSYTSGAPTINIGTTTAAAVSIGRSGQTTTVNGALQLNSTFLHKNSSDSSTAFQIQNAAGGALVNVDTANSKVTVGQSSFIVSGLGATGGVGVSANSNSGGSLSGAAGTTYYYKVTGLTSNGETLASNEVSINGASFTPLGAPFFAPTVAVGAAGLLTGAYTYKVTYVSANGETTGGTTSTAVNPSAQKVNLTSIFVGPSGTIARKIYRTVAGGADGTQQLVATINDNTTTSFTDNVPDGSLGAALPASNTARTDINKASISFTTIPGAASYRIYRGTASGAENAYQTATTSPFVDTGAAGTASTPPSVDATGRIGVGTGAPTANLDIRGNVLFKNQVDTTTAFQVQNAVGSTLFNVDAMNGRVGIGTNAPGNLLSIGALTTAAGTYQLAVSTGGTANSGIVIQAVTGQSSGNLLQAQDSTGAALATIDYQGNLTVKSGTFNGTLTVNGHIVTGNTSGNTTAAVNANAGTGATCTVTGNDTGGQITLTTGSASWAAGTQCTVTFAGSYTGTAPHPVITPANATDTSAVKPYVDVPGSSPFTTWTLNFINADTAGNTYKFNYFNAQ